ncbi:MAG: short-chain dehydrogenase/reductase [Thaumarchaeota archaeon 13_1_40CM_38_12]|nr:MAG: short-chain dehydrogenase/reductase [Thaumarchaeota archaeon 13_1_40CM_38_12]OLC34067.1 MAG: short-chain dehydrogenase/reductase [Thaumarchaeota archaeon 13_1_40CM_4_38_7]OLC93176.1 MAG: short-chain dehydrogenase/reductase [Thaumarchaeota archaeon 13_1_40CM_3_38_6]OLD41686.1 MAG: short-chain dehydrogenase/reductase [Thaumarchaeota archaeon 13_1_40CM_2_39_4]TLY08005.1 MAG: SDR family oxidoreductase [Nitrososphaerota archaeon]
MEKIAVVTGSSSGIGFETSLALAREGYYTYATMRDTKKGNKILDIAKKENLKVEVLELDVDKETSIKNAIGAIIRDKNRIDILVNNAGYGLFGCLEDLSMEDLKAQFETNFFGVVRTIQGILPIMRKQKSGIIVNVSSVAGRIGFPVSPAYISSKFALEGLSESMRYELEPFGIKTIIIEPGVIKTNFMTSLKKSMKPDSVYKEIAEKVINGIAMMAEMGTPPQEVARTIIKAITSENPLPRYPVGNDAIMFLEAKKNKTDLEFENYIKKELYS